MNGSITLHCRKQTRRLKHRRKWPDSDTTAPSNQRAHEWPRTAHSETSAGTNNKKETLEKQRMSKNQWSYLVPT